MVHCSMGASVRYAVTSSQLGSTMAKTSAASAPSTYSAPRSTFVFGIGSGRFSAGTEKSESMPRSAPTGSTFESPAGLSIASNARSSRALTPARGPLAPAFSSRRDMSSRMTRAGGPATPRLSVTCRTRLFAVSDTCLHVFRHFSPCGPQRVLARGSVEGGPVLLARGSVEGSQLSLEATPRGVPLEACAGEMQCLAVAPGPVPTVNTARPRVNVGVSRARVGARGAGVRLAASAGTSPRDDAFSTSRPIYPPGDHGLTPRPRVSRRSPPRSSRTPQTTRRTAR